MNMDETLVTQAQAGQTEALGELFQRYWKACRGVAHSIVGDIAMAEDIASEAFLEASRCLDKLQQGSRFYPWLRTITRRKAFRWMSRSQRNVPLVDVALGYDLFEELERQDLARWALSHLNRLPERLRETAVLHYLEKYSVADVAHLVQIPEGTVKRRLHEARQSLQKLLTEIPDKAGCEARERMLLAWEKGGEELFLSFRQALGHRDALVPWTGPVLAKASLTPLQKAVLEPSDRVANPDHPIGRVAQEIRSLLPLAILKRSPCSSFPLTKPGMALRFTRALLGPFSSVSGALTQSHSLADLGRSMRTATLADVADVYFASLDNLQLSQLQVWLGRLAAHLLPGSEIRFQVSQESPHRYRSALTMHRVGVIQPAARGGILQHDQSGLPASHLRLYLDSWVEHPEGELSQDSLVEFLSQAGFPGSGRGDLQDERLRRSHEPGLG